MEINRAIQLKQNNQIIARNTIFLTIRMVVVLGIGIYTSRVLLHTLGVEDFGIYNVVCGFVAMFGFLNTSMNNGIQRFYNYELGKNGEEGARRVYHCSLITQTIIAVVVLVFAETFGLWYVYNKLVVPPERLLASVWVYHSAIISLLFLILQIPYSAAIMAHEKMDYYAICSVLDVVIKLLIVLSLPFINYDHLVVYGLLMICISVLNFCLYFVYSKIHFSEVHGLFSLKKNLLKEMISFSGWNLFGSLSGVMKEQGLNVVLNLFFGPIVNAAQGLAYQVSSGVQSFIINITTAARPQLTQSYAQGNIDRTIHIMFSMSKMSYICIYILALPVMLEVNFILKVWLGDTIPDHTNMFVILVVAYSLINVFNPPVSFVVHATGKMRNYQLVSSFCSLCLLPLSYLILCLGAKPEFIFVLNIIFMAITQVLSLIILHYLVYFSILDYFKSVFSRCILLSIVAAIFPVIANVFLSEGIIRFFLVSILSAISVIILSYFIVFNSTEQELVQKYIGKFIKR